MNLLDGKKIAQDIKSEIALEIKNIVQNGGKIPHLAAVLVGNDGASETYVASKVKACSEVGMKSTEIRLKADISESELIQTIQKLNSDNDIDGFIVQLPLPSHISESRIIEAIKPEKDVDGFHPVNVGRMVIGLPAFVSATPYGIMQLIKRTGIITSGRHCVVLGRSNIVGTPMAILMSRKAEPGNATVTVCHSRTPDIAHIARTADILIAALGQPHFVKADMVKEGAVVIDVGITRVSANDTKSGFKLIGDVKFDEVAPKCSFITPVPGGVGPMTIVSLLSNTLLASKGMVYPK